MEKQKAPFRNLVCGVENKVPLPDGRLVPYINFDNAASTPPLKSVLEKINEFAPWYSSVHRGRGYKSQLTTRLYEETRQIIADFVGADLRQKEIIFTTNTTAAINKLAYRLHQPDKEQVVISSRMEHHSNDLPWRDKYQVEYIPLTSSGQLSLSALKYLLEKHRGRVTLVTVTGASNVSGVAPPVHQIARLVHRYKSQIMVDGAQLIPHLPFDLKNEDSPEHIDYLTFSAHKLYAPFGCGVLIGPRQTFKKGAPEYTGGGTVRLVTPEIVQWYQPPHKEEAGSPNVMGVVALRQAIETLMEIGMEEIAAYENMLNNYLLQKLEKIPELILYTPGYSEKQLAIIPFNIRGINHKKTAEYLAWQKGIAVRSGCFCAQPYVQKLLGVPDEQVQKRLKKPTAPHPGMVRISLGLYNTRQEINRLSKVLSDIIPS